MLSIHGCREQPPSQTHHRGKNMDSQNIRSFAYRAEAAKGIVGLERLAEEIDDRNHPQREGRELAIVEAAMVKARAAADEGTLEIASIASLVRAFPLWSGRHSLIRRIAGYNCMAHDQKVMLNSLADISVLLGHVDPNSDGGDSALVALRDAAMPFLQITGETSEDDMVLVENMLKRLNVPESIRKDLSMSAGEHGADLCNGASDAVRLANRFECVGTHNILLEQFALRLGVEGMDTNIALELLRGIYRFDNTESGSNTSCTILRLLVPFLSAPTEEGDEQASSFKELCELASFVQDPDRDGVDSRPAESAIILTARVGTVHETMKLACSFRVESGAHSVLLDFIRRNRSPNEEGAIVLVSMVRSRASGGEEMLAEIAADCQENGWGFDPVEFTGSRMRETSASMFGEVNFAEMLHDGSGAVDLGEGSKCLGGILLALREAARG